VPGSLGKKGGRRCHFFSTEDNIFFSLFCHTNTALSF
jgi:hypothetical protein